MKLNDASTNDMPATKSVVARRLHCKENPTRAQNEVAAALADAEKIVQDM